MNGIVLPPKEFESPISAKYDQIRYRTWFQKLSRRHGRRLRLRFAHSLVKEGETMAGAARRAGVNVRDMWDYIAFVEGKPKPRPKAAQRILDDAYVYYNRYGASQSIRFFIKKLAPMYGEKPNAIADLWEADPTFYPTGYLI